MNTSLSRSVETPTVQDKFQDFGKNHPAKFRAIHIHHNIPLDDVRQTAILVHLEKFALYDQSRPLHIFLLVHLIWRIRRMSLGPHKYSISLDDDDNLEIQTQSVSEFINNEMDDGQDWKMEEISTVPELLKFHRYAKSISGKSAVQIAKTEGVSVRRVNQKLKKMRDQAEILRAKINKNPRKKK